jgi:hypothetical protein
VARPTFEYVAETRPSPREPGVCAKLSALSVSLFQPWVATSTTGGSTSAKLSGSSSRRLVSS